MSAPDRTSSFNLEYLQKESKRLLREARAGDAAAIAAVQAALPRLKGLDARRVAAEIQLADVHQALARRHGFTSWADLTRHGNPLSRLLAAVRGGHVQMLRRDMRDFVGLADVSVPAACALGHSDTLARHLHQDANLATVAHDGWAPLMYVCASPLARFSARHAMSLLACAEILLEAGADANASAPMTDAAAATETPAIMRAMMSGNMALMILLKKHGATEPHEAARQWMASQMPPDAADLHVFFGEYFRRPETKELMRKAREEFQVQGGPLPEYLSDPRELQQFRMPNMLGARAHLWAAMLDRGFDVSAMGVGGTSALHGVVTYAPATVIEMYLARGGDPNVRDSQGRSVLATAVRAGNLEVADLLRARGVIDDASPMDRLLGACLAGDSDRARRLVSEHPDLPNALSREDADSLVRAAARGDLEQVRLMLDVGIRPDDRNEAGASALHQAAWRGQVATVRLLVERGASFGEKDEMCGQTPREWALHGSRYAQGAHDRCLEVARLLEEVDGPRNRK